MSALTSYMVMTDEMPIAEDAAGTRDAIDVSHDILSAAYTRVRDFGVGFYRNYEGVIILSCAAIGISSLIGELVFAATLPLWVEAAFIIPVFSCLVVWYLTHRIEKRALKTT